MSPPPSRRPGSSSEDGYILLTLVLFVALLAIAAVVMAPVIKQQIKRDREEEMIHRGVQYSRAIKHYYKKFSRYPTRLEDLENTNNLRFLRRRYKDPITGKDFKLLRMGDVQMGFGGGIAGAVPVNGMNPGSPGTGALGTIVGNAFNAPSGISAQGGFNSPSPFNSSGGAGGPGANPNMGPGGFNSGPGGLAGQNSQPAVGDTDANQTVTAGGTAPGAPGAQGAAGSGSDAGPSNTQVFGGGPVVGVVSTSKEKTIRIFNKKEHYNEWQFIYDPTTDTGGLLATPNIPSLQAGGGLQAVPPTPGANGGLPGQMQQPGAQPTQGVQPPGMQTPQLPPDQSEN